MRNRRICLAPISFVEVVVPGGQGMMSAGTSTEWLMVADAGHAAGMPDLEVSGLRVRPRERLIQFGSHTVPVEPLVMQLLLALSRRAGQLVGRREIFDLCWGSSPVGDDSLNRIVAVLRKVLQQTTGGGVRIETVPGAGYILRIVGSGEAPIMRRMEVQRAIEAGFDSWRLGLPEPDHLRLEQLRAACAMEPSNATAWGMLALLCRHAAEYGGAASASAYLRECERAARLATEIEPEQPEASAALVSVVPLFGGWAEARERLLAICRMHSDSAVPAQELATLEMATGCVREGKRLRDRLIARDPLAAIFCYKSVYQHWSIGELAGMDHVAERAMLLWPTHPAVWNVRLWTLALTGRVTAAMNMLDDDLPRPDVPVPALSFLRQVLPAAESGQAASIEAAVDAARKLARTGPANAIAAMFALKLLCRDDVILGIADAYYLRAGPEPVPVNHTSAELSLNEHHRPLTQILFTPVFAEIRSDPRFMVICERIGLCNYWETSGLTPDFLA